MTGAIMGETLTFGRELDALIAEKVMGWKWVITVPGAHETPMPKWCKETMGMRYLREPEWFPGGIGLQALSDGSEPKAPLICDYCAIFPRFSTNIAAAWTVVERLRGMGWLVTVKSMPPSASFILEGSRSEYDAPSPDKFVGQGKCACDLHWAVADGYRPGEFVFADTAPLAICLAALKAVGATGEAA